MVRCEGGQFLTTDYPVRVWRAAFGIVSKYWM